MGRTKDIKVDIYNNMAVRPGTIDNHGAQVAGGFHAQQDGHATGDST